MTKEEYQAQAITYIEASKRAGPCPRCNKIMTKIKLLPRYVCNYCGSVEELQDRLAALPKTARTAFLQVEQVEHDEFLPRYALYAENKEIMRFALTQRLPKVFLLEEAVTIVNHQHDKAS
jgi:ribosomal protein S27AE